MRKGAVAMRDFALAERVELALLTDMSAACRFDQPRRFQVGVGVATALLLEAGVPVLSQRDFKSLARLRERLEPGFVAPEGLLDHHEHPWTVAHFGAR
jgi:hypothetical protein